MKKFARNLALSFLLFTALAVSAIYAAMPHKAAATDCPPPPDWRSEQMRQLCDKYGAGDKCAELVAYWWRSHADRIDPVFKHPISCDVR